MNTSTLQYILDRYDPENDIGPITYADAALLEMVIDLAERVRELEAMLKPAPALVQPTMFQAGEDTPLFTLPEAEPEWVTAFNQSSAEPSAPPDAKPPCFRCGHRPSDFGRVQWKTCDHCDAPVCPDCAIHSRGYYCSENCWHAATD